MTGLYGFLCFLENSPATQRNSEHYRRGSGREFLEFCIRYDLVSQRGYNAKGEELFSLTKQGEKLVRSQNFNDAVDCIMKEAQE